LEQLEYAETVIEQVHIRTLRGDLVWECFENRISADPVSSIKVLIRFEDEEVNSAIWEHVLISHPVGKALTMLGNPSSAKAHLNRFLATGQTLDRVNAIFRHVLLEPREKAFEAAMKELCQ
jgi:hypothetical protein